MVRITKLYARKWNINFKERGWKRRQSKRYKFILAEELVDRFHKAGDGTKCKEAFLQRFQKGTLPDDIKEVSLKIENKSIPITNLLKNAEMTASTSEAMRLIKQGGVKINSEKVSDVKLEIEKGSEAIYQVGKRKFLKIIIR